MTTPVPEDQIEAIVGVSRHPSRHIARAVSGAKVAYIMHPDNCAARLTYRPLTECRYSRSLALLGIDERLWAADMDAPVFVLTDIEGRLFPAGPAGGVA